MKQKTLSDLSIFLILMSSLALMTLASESQAISAVITDIADIPTVVDNLTLSELGFDYNYKYIGGGYPSKWYDYNDMTIKRGESTVDVQFDKIKQIEFDWENENKSANITLDSGTIIFGKPLSKNSVEFGSWFIKGDTDFGSFEIQLNKTKNIKFLPTKET